MLAKKKSKTKGIILCSKKTNYECNNTAWRKHLECLDYSGLEILAKQFVQFESTYFCDPLSSIRSRNTFW